MLVANPSNVNAYDEVRGVEVWIFRVVRVRAGFGLDCLACIRRREGCLSAYAV